VRTSALVRFAVIAGLAAALLSSCGGAQPPIGPPDAMPQTVGLPNVTQKYLYLGLNTGRGPTLLVYPLDGSKPLRKIVDSWRVVDLAVDPWGDVYTSNDTPTGGEVTAYTPDGGSLLLTMYSGAVNCMTFDTLGDLYACDNEYIAEFAPRSTKRIRLSRDAVNVWDLTLDRTGKLYAAQLTGKGSENNGAVKVFRPRGQRPFRVLRRGVSSPTALAFDSSGNLYVANCPGCWSEKGNGSVAEYAPGSDTPLRVLTEGINTPTALAIGPQNELFVANNPDLDLHGAWISVYRSSGRSPTHRIRKGIDNVLALALDTEGNLYVVCGCNHTNEVAVYNEHFALTRSITDGVAGAESIAIGP
jgi:hypothetical protein